MLKEATLVTKEKFFDVIKNYSVKIIFFKAVYFLFGLFISHAGIFGEYYPFGISFAASAPGKMLLPATVGSILGYLFPLRMAIGVRYISSLIAIGTIRWALSDLTKIKKSKLYIPAIAFISSFTTGMAINYTADFGGKAVLISFFESLISGSASYFFEQSFKTFSKKAMEFLSLRNFVCISMSLGILMLSFSHFSFMTVSVGRILAVASILFVANGFGIAGGTIFGICVGIVFSLQSFGFDYISGTYAFGGLIAGMCSRWGKLWTCLTFLIVSILVSFQSGDASKIITLIYEITLGASLFLLLPKSFFEKFGVTSGEFFAPEQKPDNLKSFFTQKLNFVSKSLICVPKIVGKVSEGFRKKSLEDFKNKCKESVYEVCSSCTSCGLCYNIQCNRTESEISKAIIYATNEQNINEKVFSTDFLKRCKKKDEIIKTINRENSNYNKQKSKENSMKDVRKIADEQLQGVGVLLKEISGEVEAYEPGEQWITSQIKTELKRSGINVLNATHRKNKSKKEFIELEIKSDYREKLSEIKLSKIVSNILGKKFGEPVITGLGDSFRVQMCEQTNYCVEINACQHCCGGGSFCGDSYKYFEDGEGNFNVIISDGMGTGKQAAIEGEVASELMKSFVKAGMGFNCASKLVNSSLILGSNDENLSTLDVLSVNLFSGTAKFMKAGAPLTFIIKNGEIKKLSCNSLPIGIFTNVTAYEESINLTSGDWVIMLSDGVTDIGEDWIEQILKSKKYSNTNELAHKIVNTAVSMRGNDHDDDITSIVLKIKNAIPN